MASLIERIPPHDHDAEQALVAAMLVSRETIPTIREQLTPASFYRGAYATIFAAVIAVYERNEPVDLITVRGELERRKALDDVGGYGHLVEIASSIPTIAYVDHYASIVAKCARRRDLIRLAARAAEAAYDDDCEDAVALTHQALLDLDLTGGKRGGEWRRYNEILFEQYTRTESVNQNPDSPKNCVETGFYDIDQMVTIAGKEMVVIAARTGYGKTALAWDIARNIARKGGLVGVFSLEMSKEAVARRAMASATGLSIHQQLKGSVGDDQWGTMLQAINESRDLDLYIHDKSNITLAGIESACRQLESLARRKLDAVIVDYLQLVEGDGKGSNENETTRTAKVSRGLKTRIAGDFDCPVFALAQLNRSVDGTDSKRPELRNIKQSGAIEQDASIVFFIHREGHLDGKPLESGPVEIIVAKNRNGAQGSASLFWDSSRARFTNFQPYPAPAYEMEGPQ